MEPAYDLNNVSFRVCLAWTSEFAIEIDNQSIMCGIDYPLHWTIRDLSNTVNKVFCTNNPAAVKIFHHEYPSEESRYFHLISLSKTSPTFRMELSSGVFVETSEVVYPFESAISFSNIKSAVDEAKEVYLGHLEREFPDFFPIWMSEPNTHFGVFS